MATVAVLSAPITEVLAGNRYTTYTVTNGATTVVADEFLVPIPQFATHTLLEADLTGAAGAATIQPALGVAPAFVIGGAGFVVQAAAPATSHRIGQDKRLTARPIPPSSFGYLYVRLTPDVDLVVGQAVITRITYRWGQI